MGSSAVFFVCSFLISIVTTSNSLEIINPGQSMRDGQTLVSTGSFELGFFSPEGSTSRYLGLWHKKSPQAVLWVANRENSLSDSMGALNITTQGILILVNSTNHTVWSSNSSATRSMRNPVAQLLESGNFVVRDGNDSNPANFVWQSFDNPCDTLIPGMRLGINFVTRMDLFLSSWKSSKDPARGEFSYRIDPHGYPQLVMMGGNATRHRTGSWNGITFTANPRSKTDPSLTNEFVLNSKEVYFEYGVQSTVLRRFTLNPLGLRQIFTWNDRTQDWVTIESGHLDPCENYKFCGPNTRCEVNRTPICGCLDGFTPKSPVDWNVSDWSGGCIRRTPLDCNDTDGFRTFEGNKLPDTSFSWFDKSIGLKECERLCLKNCSCSAYTNLDIRGGGSGCLIWFGDLIDMRRSTGDGQDVYVRMAASELVANEKKGNISKKKKGAIYVSTAVLGIAMLMLGMFLCKRRRNHGKYNNFEEVRKEDMELPIFDLITVANATDNFSSTNKLGEGGFGPVYKGILIEGQEIAVKRLSKNSGQGLNEFKNEVILIARLQHRNLVKLFGCCFHEDEKMLIYEFMPNKSLDLFIFDQTGRKLLDWSKRMNIIGGIARGLLYLHQDSRLRVIHRDIKASNILLDEELTPKISDFGLARMFREDQTEADTRGIVGTYGYMSPEYASTGHFSVKTDVFSFGVLILETVSGKKNKGFRDADLNLNLLGHAWILWIKRMPLELIDECLACSSNTSEVLRCVHVALLCVQQRPEDRPNISTVVQILCNENPLPQPKQPGFFMGKNPLEQDTSSNQNEACSLNEVSLTLFEAR